ncbi:hypothetical protein IFM89_004258 [Coptis chinensis]|uniref:F-box domain-containing protein n=1 Tax=Coptis chinensis TaxID=261450 RepID=A0A835LYD3_9MAGN|nr:hypothetical protein IFM89_004258 [Coptis chinensis]
MGRPRSRKIQWNVSLPEEILMDILLRLPVKGLLLCKSVCKYWQRVISSSQFVKLQMDRGNQNNHRLIFTAKPNTGITLLYTLEYETSKVAINCNLSLPRQLYMVGSCNGLVCLSDKETYMALCNPATKEHKFVPFDLVEEVPAD